MNALKQLFRKPAPTPAATPSRESWSAAWITQQVTHSQHPPELWRTVADTVIEGRSIFNNNPNVPIGQYALQTPGAFEMLVARNNKGITLEERGEIEAAIVVYEASIADAFSGTHPYDRLRILYTKRQWYTDAIRVCRAGMAIPRLSAETKTHFKHHLEKLQDKLQNQHR